MAAPGGIAQVEEAAAEIDPEARPVTTAGGTRVPYDFLIVATGLTLDWDAIEGLSPDLVGMDGVRGRTAQPHLHHRGIRYRGIRWPAGQPRQDRGAALLNGKGFVTVPIVSERIRTLVEERDIRCSFDNPLTAIEPGRRILTFAIPEGTREEGHDFVHVIPPMRAPDVVRDSPLPRADKRTDPGRFEVSPETLRLRRFPGIFVPGDVVGVPKRGTAAPVKRQVSVVEDHRGAAIGGREGDTSCAMIIRIVRAMRVGFDGKSTLPPSFPGVIAPLEEPWIS